jgi:hypothetical protein
MSSTNLPPLTGTGLLLRPDQESLQVQYRIPRRQKYIRVNEVSTPIPTTVEFGNGEMVLEAGTIPDNTVATLQLADGTKRQVIVNRRVKSTPPTYDIAIGDLV